MLAYQQVPEPRVTARRISILPTFSNQSKSSTQNAANRIPSRRQIVPILACAVLSLLSSGVARSQSAPSPLRIAAAADLQPVLPPVLAEFEKQTGIHAEATYQASAALTSQIQNGAPFDLFLSADLSYPARLIESGAGDNEGIKDPSGAVHPKSPVTYAHGTLVLWTRKDSRWPSPTLATLSDPALKRLAIANPERAPYGRAAVAALTSLKLYDALKPKLVTAENISQTAQFAETGNADAGLISLTSAKTAHLSSLGNYFVIPRESYPPIEQGAVIVSKTNQRQAASRFLEFLSSPGTQQQLAKSGLTPVR